MPLQCEDRYVNPAARPTTSTSTSRRPRRRSHLFEARRLWRAQYSIEAAAHRAGAKLLAIAPAEPCLIVVRRTFTRTRRSRSRGWCTRARGISSKGNSRHEPCTWHRAAGRRRAHAVEERRRHDPRSAGLARRGALELRISVAAIERDGPFSDFTGSTAGSRCCAASVSRCAGRRALRSAAAPPPLYFDGALAPMCWAARRPHQRPQPAGAPRRRHGSMARDARPRLGVAGGAGARCARGRPRCAIDGVVAAQPSGRRAAVWSAQAAHQRWRMRAAASHARHLVAVPAARGADEHAVAPCAWPRWPAASAWGGVDAARCWSRATGCIGSGPRACLQACPRRRARPRRRAGHAGPDRLPHPPRLRRPPRSEFEQRLQGASYEDIARAGGGIRSTVAATRAADGRAVLAAAGARRADGRGRDHDRSQIRLRPDATTKRAACAWRGAWRRELPLTVRTTSLAAHALPPEFDRRADDYIDAVVQLAAGVARRRAGRRRGRVLRHIGFTPAQTRRVFDAARRAQLPVKLHAEQLSDRGGPRS